MTPHPLTEFITVKYAYTGKSLNSQIVPARVVCQFFIQSIGLIMKYLN